MKMRLRYKLTVFFFLYPQLDTTEVASVQFLIPIQRYVHCERIVIFLVPHILFSCVPFFTARYRAILSRATWFEIKISLASGMPIPLRQSWNLLIKCIRRILIISLNFRKRHHQGVVVHIFAVRLRCRSRYTRQMTFKSIGGNTLRYHRIHANAIGSK